MDRSRRRIARRSASRWVSSGSRSGSKMSRISPGTSRVRWRRLSRSGAALLAAALAAFFLPRVAASDEFDALREDFLSAINAERARDGVVALRLSRPLNRLAQDLAEDFSRRGERDFGRVSEGEIVSRAQKAGYPVKTLK